MSYRHDMSGEKAPKRKVCLPKGWRRFKIETVEEAKSKQGNDMFIFTLTDLETLSEHDVYAIATQGKRWFLKNILAACNVEAAQDGVYDWDKEDVIGQLIQGFVEHEPNEWTDRKGQLHTDMQSKIVDVKEDSGEVSVEDGTFETEQGKKF